MNRTTALALTVDVEGEWFELPGEQGSFDLNRVLLAVANLESLLDRIESRLGTGIPVTWFIRCDDSVAAATGEASGLLQALDTFIQRRFDKGDAFGLHPHLYRLSEGRWGPETSASNQQAQLERAASAWENYFGVRPKLARMGEAVMNNTLAACLDKLGIAIDSSALPGRKRFDSGFQFDWMGTPSSPYHPSVEDYRRPAVNQEAAHGFIECPFTMLPILGPQDRGPIMRYCNLAFRPDLIKRAAQSIDVPERVTAVVHPHELLSSDQQHPLIAHSPSALEENMLNLISILGGLEFTLLSLHATQ